MVKNNAPRENMFWNLYITGLLYIDAYLFVINDQRCIIKLNIPNHTDLYIISIDNFS